MCDFDFEDNENLNNWSVVNIKEKFWVLYIMIL